MHLVWTQWTSTPWPKRPSEELGYFVDATLRAPREEPGSDLHWARGSGYGLPRPSVYGGHVELAELEAWPSSMAGFQMTT